jgi:ketosteroid isomerase-like protein
MVAISPEQAVELLDRAFEEKDLETVLSFYEDSAVVVSEPGALRRGKEELRILFERAMQMGSSAKQLKSWTIEADGVALFLSRWELRVEAEGREPSVRNFVATTVFRRQADGRWKILIDNPVGPLVLGAE